MTATILNIIRIVFILMSFLPLFRHRNVFQARLKKIKEIEVKRKSRVIALIHRQESISILGLPISRYITIEDSEQIQQHYPGSCNILFHRSVCLPDIDEDIKHNFSASLSN